MVIKYTTTKSLAGISLMRFRKYTAMGAVCLSGLSFAGCSKKTIDPVSLQTVSIIPEVVGLENYGAFEQDITESSVGAATFATSKTLGTETVKLAGNLSAEVELKEVTGGRTNAQQAALPSGSMMATRSALPAAGTGAVTALPAGTEYRFILSTSNDGNTADKYVADITGTAGTPATPITVNANTKYVWKAYVLNGASLSFADKNNPLLTISQSTDVLNAGGSINPTVVGNNLAKMTFAHRKTGIELIFNSKQTNSAISDINAAVDRVTVTLNAKNNGQNNVSTSTQVFPLSAFTDVEPSTSTGSVKGVYWEAATNSKKAPHFNNGATLTLRKADGTTKVVTLPGNTLISTLTMEAGKRYICTWNLRGTF